MTTSVRRLAASLVLFSSFFVLTACGGGSSSAPDTGSSSTSSSSGSSSSSSSGSVIDTTPNGFSFAPVTNAARNAEVTSDTVEIDGIDASAAVSIEGGRYAIEGDEFTAEPGTIEIGQSLVLRVVASTEFGTAASATVTIGGVAAVFTVTTIAQDTTPDSFGFTSQKDAEPEVVVTSDVVTITGINDSADVTIIGGLYAINGGAFTSDPGTITTGQTLTLQVTSSGHAETEVTATVTVGGVEGAFSVTTPTDDTAPEAAITFPPPMSATDQETLLIRGTAEDDYRDRKSVV